MEPPFEYALTPQYYDFDPSQIVHNATYVRWLEDARVATLTHVAWPPARWYADDLVPLLTRTEIVYKRPIGLTDRVSVRVWLTKLGRTVWSVALHFVHPETGTVYARAAQDGCVVRKSTGRPAAMPPELLAIFRDYQARTGEPPA